MYALKQARSRQRETIMSSVGSRSDCQTCWSTKPSVVSTRWARRRNAATSSDGAPEIVTLTYGLLLGPAALAMALAFGLGGRDVAASMLEEAYSKGREQRAQVRRDLELGKQRGRQDAERVTAEAERRTGRGNDGRTETAAYRAAQ